MKTKHKVGLSLMAFSIVFAATETTFFGGNLHAASLAEALCDLVALTSCFTGAYVLLYPA